MRTEHFVLCLQIGNIDYIYCSMIIDIEMDNWYTVYKRGDIMPKIQVNLFSENEYDFYQYRIRYHVEQYIPELFPKKSGDELRTHIGNIGKIAGVVKRIGDIGTLDSSGALIMTAGVKRPDEILKRETQYKSLNDPNRSDEVQGNTCSLDTIADGTEKQLMQFVNFVLQTDVPMKPLGYIFLRKLEQYSFWKTWEGDEIPPSQFGDVLTAWSAFKQYRVDWISTQRKESLDGFAQENIFRCLKLISQHRTTKIENTEYFPIRIWIDDVGWLYRRKIPYLVARPINNLDEFELFRLDQHVFVEKGNKPKNASVSWVDEQAIQERLGVSENKNISGAYFYHGDPYIRGKLGLDDCDCTNVNEMGGLTITFPYQILTDGETIQKVGFKKEFLSISEVERKLLMRSCGEFVQFDDAPTNKWDSAKEWEESKPSIPACAGSPDKEIGLINPKYTSFDAICAPFSCIQLATVSNPQNNRYEEGWNALKCISSEDVTEWWITDTELDWLYAVLIDNAELASQFGVGDELASKINEELGKMEKVFRPSAYCKTEKRRFFPQPEAIWNQDFHMLSSDDALTNKAMQRAMQCMREHKLLSYRFKFDENNDKSWEDCLIYPYRFQITKERKIQLLTYDLKKFKLLTINDFGSSRYEDIKCGTPSEFCGTPSELSESAKWFLLCAALAAPKDNRDNSEKLLAAREIVYYYRLLVGEPEENPYTGNGYDCGKLRDMLDSLKTECESVKERSVFEKVQVNGKELSVCSRMIMGGNLWEKIRPDRGITNWTIAWWLRQYEKKLDGTTIQVSKPKKISSKTFNNKYTSVMKKQRWSTPILSAAFGYYQTYIEATCPDEQYMWNNDVYHSDKELRHIYKILQEIFKCNQIENVTVSDNDLIKYIQAEIKNLNDAKQCTALLGICGELSMAKLDLIYHIFNEFDLTTEAVVCDPEDYDSEDANKFEIVRCIRVKYSSYDFRKLHEGILALQDFVYPLAPSDLKNIIQTREENMKTIYNWGGTTDESTENETV